MGANWSYQSNSDYLEDEISSEEESENEEIQINNQNSKNNDFSQSQDILDNNCFDSATDTIDAVPPGATMIITLQPEEVIVVENALELYEKVSLIFLLFDNPNLALDQITKLMVHDEKFIYKWACEQSLNNKWQETLVEALCIIQNYEVLKLLNFRREDLVIRFLPHHSFTSMYVNKIRKAFYFVCESLIEREVEIMLNLLYSDMERKNFHLQYLELHFLHLEAVGYIQQNNFSNICNILKQMGQFDLYDMIKDLGSSTNNSFDRHNETVKHRIRTVQKKSESLFDEILNPSSSLSTLASIEGNISSDNVAARCENKYHIDLNNPGVCLIINQENFYREIDPSLAHLLPNLENKLDSRIGTERDKTQIQKTFNSFGFKTIAVDNLVHSDIIKKIEEVMMDITHESSLFVCILSHGDEGIIYGVNSCRVAVKAIKHAMVTKNRKHLLGKPKVLILQSCQGTRCQKVSTIEEDEIVTDGPTSSLKEAIPPSVDLFTFWATVPGYGAIRNKKTGSWFIQSLCDKMQKLATSHHFEDICTSVIDDVSTKQWIQTNEPVAMVPLKDSTLRKKFYLPLLRD